jgi:cystathionine gamma-lyase
MRQHQENAVAVAEYLAGHPAVDRVFYPGLQTHPGHDIARRQMKGFGGMVSFEIRGGQIEAESFLRELEIFTIAESLGGVTSLAELPATMSHASMPPEFREKVGISERLVRLSIGLENKADLIDDLKRGLAVTRKE